MFTLFFVAPEELNHDRIELHGPAAHHAISVLRVKVNELIRLADGQGKWIEGPITHIERGALQVEVRLRGADPAPKVSVTIAQALLKGENQKAALDQLVQAGVDSIIPWQAQHSVGALDKSQKWRDVVIVAAQQSRRAQIPTLAPLMDYAAMLALRSEFDCTIAFHESGNISLNDVNAISSARSVLAIIGPEGGLSEAELELLRNAEIPLVKLGNPVIRADLAGAIALGGLKVLTKEW